MRESINLFLRSFLTRLDVFGVDLSEASCPSLSIITAYLANLHPDEKF
jgi:hypothetical protein